MYYHVLPVSTNTIQTTISCYQFTTFILFINILLKYDLASKQRIYVLPAYYYLHCTWIVIKYYWKLMCILLVHCIFTTNTNTTPITNIYQHIFCQHIAHILMSLVIDRNHTTGRKEITPTTTTTTTTTANTSG